MTDHALRIRVGAVVQTETTPPCTGRRRLALARTVLGEGPIAHRGIGAVISHESHGPGFFKVVAREVLLG